MHELNLAVAVCAGTIVALGLISARIQRWPVSRPILALAVGVLAGPLVSGALAPEAWPQGVLRKVAEFTLAISVMGVALRTPREHFRDLLRPVAVLLTLGMAAMWLVSSTVAWAALGIAPLAALALGAAATPTDPVVASSIVTGEAAEKTLPDAVRSTLSIESGANDGLGYALVMLPVLFLHGEGLGVWLWRVIAIEIGLAVVVGAALGGGVGWLLHQADRWHWTERHSMLGATVALSLLAVTLTTLIGADGILGAFAAGLAFHFSVDRREDFEEQNVQETISKLFSLPVFVLLGAALPVAGWRELGWPGLAFAAGLLVLRRPVMVALLAPLLGPRLGRAESAYLAWFAPVGIAALYYALLLEERTGQAIYWEATSLAIVASILAHGVTSGPGLWVYERVTRARKAA